MSQETQDCLNSENHFKALFVPVPVTHVFNNPTVTLCFCDAASEVFKQLHGNLLKDFWNKDFKK